MKLQLWKISSNSRLILSLKLFFSIFRELWPIRKKLGKPGLLQKSCVEPKMAIVAYGGLKTKTFHLRRFNNIVLNIFENGNHFFRKKPNIDFSELWPRNGNSGPNPTTVRPMQCTPYHPGSGSQCRVLTYTNPTSYKELCSSVTSIIPKKNRKTLTF